MKSLSTLAARTGKVSTINAHFPFGPRGSTVSGRQRRKGLEPPVGVWAKARTLAFNRFSQDAFAGKAISIPVSKVQRPEPPGTSSHSTHAHSAEADVATARRELSAVNTMRA